MPDFVKQLRGIAQMHPLLTAQSWINNPIGSLRNKFAYGGAMGVNDPNFFMRGSQQGGSEGQDNIWVRIHQTLDEIKSSLSTESDLLEKINENLDELNEKFNILTDSEKKTKKLSSNVTTPLTKTSSNATSKITLPFMGMTDKDKNNSGDNINWKSLLSSAGILAVLEGGVAGLLGSAIAVTYGWLALNAPKIIKDAINTFGGSTPGVKPLKDWETNPAHHGMPPVIPTSGPGSEASGKDIIKAPGATDVIKDTAESYLDKAKPIWKNDWEMLRGLFSGPSTPHATGGPLTPGHEYTVGEKGPEKVVVDKSGMATVLANTNPSDGTRQFSYKIDILIDIFKKYIDVAEEQKDKMNKFIDKIIGIDNRKSIYAVESGYNTGRKFGLMAGVGLDAFAEGTIPEVIPAMTNVGGMLGGTAGMVLANYRNRQKSNVKLKPYKYVPPKTTSEFIARNEGFEATPYADPGAYGVGHAIGYGHELFGGTTVNIEGKDVDVSGGITKEQAKKLLDQDIAKASNMAINAVGGLEKWNSLKEEEKMALVDYAYNHGHALRIDPNASIKENLKSAEGRSHTRATVNRIEKEIAMIDTPSDIGTKINNKALASAGTGAPVIIKGGDTINNVSGGAGGATTVATNVVLNPTAPYNAVDMLYHLS